MGVRLRELNRGDTFSFEGDRTGDVYYYVKSDGAYSQVVDEKRNMDDQRKWAFVSGDSIVVVMDEEDV